MHISVAKLLSNMEKWVIAQSSKLKGYCLVQKFWISLEWLYPVQGGLCWLLHAVGSHQPAEQELKKPVATWHSGEAVYPPDPELPAGRTRVWFEF